MILNQQSWKISAAVFRKESGDDCGGGGSDMMILPGPNMIDVALRYELSTSSSECTLVLNTHILNTVRVLYYCVFIFVDLDHLQPEEVLKRNSEYK